MKFSRSKQRDSSWLKEKQNQSQKALKIYNTTELTEMNIKVTECKQLNQNAAISIPKCHINDAHKIIKTSQAHTYNNQSSKIKKQGSHFQRNDQKLIIFNHLQKLFFKKKRYTFQILKQFFLFPDDSQSSISCLSTYDPLIFQDETIHTLVKKLETKIIQNKIWGFINLKLRRYLKAASQIEKVTTKIYERKAKMQKRVSFDLIKKTSEDFISCISKESRFFEINSNFSLENREKQDIGVQVKKASNILSSKLIQEKVEPFCKQKFDNSKIKSMSRIYTKEEYQHKINDQKDNENRFPSLTRIKSYQELSKGTDLKPKVQFYDWQAERQNLNLQPSRNESSGNKQTEDGKRNRNKFVKYNINHYYERPQQWIHCSNQQQSHFMSHHSCSSINNASCCCFSCCSQQKIQQKSKNLKPLINCSHFTDLNCNYCIPNTNFCCNHSITPYQHHIKQKSQLINETAITQKSKSKDFKKLLKPAQSQKIINFNLHSQLSDLQSKIQYLNFLKNIVKEEEEQKQKIQKLH